MSDDDVELLRQQVRHARHLIEQFTLTDPTLWPILSEIYLALADRDSTTHV